MQLPPPAAGLWGDAAEEWEQRADKPRASLSPGKAARSTGCTPRAVGMLESKNKPLLISIKFPSLRFASRERAARLQQSPLLAQEPCPAHLPLVLGGPHQQVRAGSRGTV